MSSQEPLGISTRGDTDAEQESEEVAPRFGSGGPGRPGRARGLAGGPVLAGFSA